MATSTNTFFASSATIRRTVETSNLTVISSTAVVNSTSSPYHAIALGAVTTVFPSSSYTSALPICSGIGNYDNLPGVEATGSTVACNAAVTSVGLNGADNAQDALANVQAPSSAVQVVGN
ncbi:hypothetical protein BJ912DRAFT_1066419 [Pholiota molesta]|nr:hypothetical protein BJ912DRAFT_1066419 [Pholiota molesta]